MMLKVVPNANNRKLGPGISATHRPVGKTCPSTCPLFNHGCYAQRGHEFFVQKRSENCDDSLKAADGVGFIRHLVSGDWMKTTKDGRKIIDRAFCKAVFDWHRRPTQRFTVGWGYTHSPKQMQKAGFGPEAMPDGLHVLASCHSHDEAAQLQAEGWRTARVTEELDRGDDEAYCPYDLNKKKGVNNEEAGVNCMTCRLCFQSDVNIVFLKF